jgi:ATP-dependent DNA helicase DinG
MNKDDDSALIERILGSDGPLSQRLGGTYEVRDAQLTMARRVWTALEEGERLVVEAGTGTGKTLAYLVPAVLSGLKVVISTGTKTLQEQIVEKDIPLLLEALDLELPVATMKGISNYLCLRRFHQLRRSGAGLPGLVAPDPHLATIETWAARTETGDRAELSDLPDDSGTWAEVSPTPETRLGGRCPYYEECFVTRMRRAAAAARLVVVNHHLLLADLSIRSAYPEAGVIPAYEALILDEAHQLEEIATTFFGRSISSEKINTLARDARRIAEIEQDADALRLTETLKQSGAELFHVLQRQLPELTVSGHGHRETGDRLRLFEAPLTGPLLEPYFALDAALEALAMHLARATAGREEVANLERRVSALREEVSLFAEPPHEGYIFWAEIRRRSLALHASPVEVGPILRRALLEEPIPMVFTSATLATSTPSSSGAGGAGESDARGEHGAPPVSPSSYFRSRVGLDEHEAQVLPVSELVLPSPFDFERQTLLYLPRDLPEPASKDFIFRASERMSQLIDITAGRALVLFTSYRNMQAALELLQGQLSYPILCQGTRPRSVLLERFRRQISSVLLATASFWEGVDVVGESLSLVCIDKLPFAVPDDPLTAARMELLERRGQPPFTSYQLPQASLALKQGFGRLVRHRSDQGVVAILDRRILTRSYGRTLLESLPPSPRTSDLLRVRAFCKERLR